MASTLSAHRRLCAVVGGGFFGTITRVLLSSTIQMTFGKAWPFDIFLINITGALLLALVTTLADATLLIGPTRRLFINVGFFGAYTTFSSLALGDLLLFADAHWLSASLYLVASLGGGLLAVLLGNALGQWIVHTVGNRSEQIDKKTARHSPLSSSALISHDRGNVQEHEKQERAPFT
jgi:CrcB protein